MEKAAAGLVQRGALEEGRGRGARARHAHRQVHHAGHPPRWSSGHAGPDGMRQGVWPAAPGGAPVGEQGSGRLRASVSETGLSLITGSAQSHRAVWADPPPRAPHSRAAPAYNKENGFPTRWSTPGGATEQIPLVLRKGHIFLCPHNPGCGRGRLTKLDCSREPGQVGKGDVWLKAAAGLWLCGSLRGYTRGPSGRMVASATSTPHPAVSRGPDPPTCSMTTASLRGLVSCRCSTNCLMYGWRSTKVDTCWQTGGGVRRVHTPRGPET